LSGRHESSSLVERVVLSLCAVNRIDATVTVGGASTMLYQPNSDVHTARLLRTLSTLHLDRMALFGDYRAITTKLIGLEDHEERMYWTKEYIVKQAHLCVEQIALLPVQDSVHTLVAPVAANLLKLVRIRVGLDAEEELDATRQFLEQYFEWYEFHQGGSLSSGGAH
jgi:hypothetical protein